MFVFFWAKSKFTQPTGVEKRGYQEIYCVHICANWFSSFQVYKSHPNEYKLLYNIIYLKDIPAGIPIISIIPIINIIITHIIAIYD